MDLIEREAPLSFFAQDQMGFNAAMDVVFKVKQETAIVLTFKGMQAYVTLEIKNANLTVKINKLHINEVTYSQSQIGEYKTQELKDFFNVLFRTMIPIINQIV